MPRSADGRRIPLAAASAARCGCGLEAPAEGALVFDPSPVRVEPMARALLARVRRLDPDERRLGLAVYRALAEGGRPVRPERVAAILDRRSAAVERLLRGPALRRLALRGENREIVGFGGFTTAPTSHRLTVGGVTFYARSAWDGLSIPIVLDAPARIESVDPVDGEPIHLEVHPDGIDSVTHEGCVMSFVEPSTWDRTNRTPGGMAASRRLHFFTSRRNGAVWTMRSGDRLLTLDQGFRLSALSNRERWGLGRAARPS